MAVSSVMPSFVHRSIARLSAFAATKLAPFPRGATQDVVRLQTTVSSIYSMLVQFQLFTLQSTLICAKHKLFREAYSEAVTLTRCLQDFRLDLRRFTAVLKVYGRRYLSEDRRRKSTCLHTERSYCCAVLLASALSPLDSPIELRKALR